MMEPLVEDASYREWLANEKTEFDLKKYDSATLLEEVCEALTYTLDHFNAKVRRTLGADPWQYVADQVNLRPGAKILSLGAGPCGVEIALAKMFAVPFTFTCLDLNENLLELGLKTAMEAGISLVTIAQDANYLQLTETYDVILAHAALHHFLRFEHIFEELHEHLAADGVFIAFEPVPRNGMRLWPETKHLLDRVFPTLPPRFRREGRRGPVLAAYPDIDYTQGAFECIRSEELLSLLERYFILEHKIAGHCFIRRFVDGPLGYNYDLSREEDRAILDLLLAVDDTLSEQGALKPEQAFLVLRRRNNSHLEPS